MFNTDVETMLITSRCSGGCLPCPFAQKKCPQRYLPAEEVVSRIYRSKAQLVVITGGEPFEHPQFSEIISRLFLNSKAPSRNRSLGRFRIATGGHIPLGESINLLKEIVGFQGFSMGSDVLSRVCQRRPEHSLIWAKNIEKLNTSALPYSLTLTLHDLKEVEIPLDFDTALEALRNAASFGAKPDFVYLRTQTNRFDIRKVVSEISGLFPGIDVVLEFL